MSKILLATEPQRDLRAIGSQPVTARKDRLTRPLRLLLSYHYYKDEDLDQLLSTCFAGMTIDIFADSGAWSAWSIGKPVLEEAYISWVERWKHLFTVVAGPDVIGDAAATKAATVRMLDRVKGVPVLPVFHVGEDWGYLREYTQMSDYIALGGMVPYAKDRKLLKAWISKAFKQLPEGQRVHGFGMTTWALLLAFPWFSVDSSSWTSGFRYAQVQLFDVSRGEMVSISMADPKSLLSASSLLASYGLRASTMTARGYDRDLLCGALVESWQRAEAWLERRRGLQPCIELFNDLGWGKLVKLTSEREVKAYLASAPVSGGSGASSPTALAVGLGRSVEATRAYLACGAEGGAPNRPEGVQAGMQKEVTS